MKNIFIRMRCEDLGGCPVYSVPSPYGIRFYEPGDETAWVNIHLAADKYNRITPGLHRREFGTDARVLARRQAYLISPEGRPIGTSTAWAYDNGTGQIHWIAIEPDHQGRGLGKPLLSVTCLRLQELGHTTAELGTSSARIPAVNMYLRFGFKPVADDESQAEGWREAAKYIDDPALDPYR